MSKTPEHLQPVFPKLTVAQRKIQLNQDEFRFYVLYGTQPGPWVKVGINDTEYMFGFLPEQAPKRRPSLKVAQAGA